jgi:hypothetical protein
MPLEAKPAAKGGVSQAFMIFYVEARTKRPPGPSHYDNAAATILKEIAEIIAKLSCHLRIYCIEAIRAIKC